MIGSKDSGTQTLHGPVTRVHSAETLPSPLEPGYYYFQKTDQPVIDAIFVPISKDHLFLFQMKHYDNPKDLSGNATEISTKALEKLLKQLQSRFHFTCENGSTKIDGKNVSLLYVVPRETETKFRKAKVQGYHHTTMATMKSLLPEAKMLVASHFPLLGSRPPDNENSPKTEM